MNSNTDTDTNTWIWNKTNIDSEIFLRYQKVQTDTWSHLVLVGPLVASARGESIVWHLLVNQSSVKLWTDGLALSDKIDPVHIA